ncbi:GTPase IMAP family member 7-like [Protobothrops mucrosquamatus]|uniref:GTPase IMAP family member 7-like n=1 Tax=Protobothrops mucrosquamatus TaxID=103944 RepID=UPI000775C02C|nr:GTPase IMAP family member 7-like [Protobothrops mucrosquamatus]
MAGGIRGPERRIILIGTPGNGKSATGNTILGRPVFESSSVTQGCQKGETWLKGRKIVVVDIPSFIDTIGYWNPLLFTSYVLTEITKSVQLCSPGPHVILWVIRPLRFPQEYRDTAQLIKNIFSGQGKNYMIILFTHTEDLEGKTLERFISERDPFLRDLVSQCGNQVLAFDNKAEGEEREAQVAQLMTMIDDLVKKNRDAPCYTEDIIKADAENWRK